MFFSNFKVTHIVVDGDHCVIDEDVEAVDLANCLMDLGRAGHVKRQWRYPFVNNLPRSSSAGIYSLRSAPNHLVNEGPPDAPVGSGDQNGLIFHLHKVLLVSIAFHLLLRLRRTGGYVGIHM